MNALKLGFLAALSIWGSREAWATPVQAPHVRVDLISEQKSIQPGKSFELGFQFQLEDGWHIYWINAGDSGEGPKAKWELPKGIQAGEFFWPRPERLPVPPLVNYGYENHVLLRVPMKAAQNFSTPGQSAQISANLRWLVCREVCIPGRAKFSLSLPVNSDAPKNNPETKPFFDEARANLPQKAPASWKAVVDVSSDGQLLLKVSGDPLLRAKAKSAVFFPLEGDQVENAVPQKPRASAEGLELTLKRSDQLASRLDLIKGVLTLGSYAAYSIEAQIPGGLPPAISAPAAVSGQPPSSVKKDEAPNLFWMVLFAFVGGLILNLMPCVFPVLSIKVLSLVSSPREQRAQLKMHGLAYTAGILLSFWVLVGTLLVLRAGGQQLGWGFQLQSPAFIATLAIFFFGFGLNLMGVFEWGTSFMGVGGGLAHQEGLLGAFFTGVLATIVATPCTAPFMGSAVGFALSQSAAVAFLVFTFLALGLALPYLALSYEPSWGKILPRPGRWMETLKQFMAFPVFATVIWLSWVLGMQAGMEGLMRLLIALLIVSLAAWTAGRWAGRKAALLAALLLIAGAMAIALSGARVTEESAAPAGATYGDQVSPPTRSAGNEGLEWEKFSPDKVNQYRAQGRPVFVDFTAAWCVSCKVNELLVFRSEQVKSELKKRNFALMKADWTTYDPVITRTLAEFGRSGVPLYVIYAADRGKDPVVLPEIINPGIVLRGLESLDHG